MEQQTQKKEWTTPGLIILVQGKPEEAVLSVCKGGGLTHTAPEQNWTGCQTDYPCAPCNVFALS